MSRALPETDVLLADVTLREHGQTVPSAELDRFTVDMRARTAKKLIQAGFRRLELISCVSPRVAPAMAEPLIREVAHRVGPPPANVSIVTLVPNYRGYQTFERLGLDGRELGHTVGLFFSAIESHNRANLGRSISETVEEHRRVAERAAATSTRLVGYVSAAFGYRAAPETGPQADLSEELPVEDVPVEALVHHIHALLDLGADTVTLSDLQGVCPPEKTRRILDETLGRLSERDRPRIGYHPHHPSPDGGLALVEAAYEAGIRLFDSSIGAVGGCVTGAPGNVATEGVVDLFAARGVRTGIDKARFDEAASAFSAR